MAGVGAFVLEAEVELDDGCDPAAVGAAVTVELCGHWEHEGPCRWPHNSAIDPTTAPAVFRTIYVAAPGEADSIRDRIRAALDTGGWRLVATRERPVSEQERELADRLLAGPRLED